MPIRQITDPYLNLWISDTPIFYRPAFGPDVRLTLTFRTRQDMQTGPLNILGSTLGMNNEVYLSQQWRCSWLSGIYYDSYSGNQATVYLPDGSKYTFNFPTGSNVSSMLYYGSLWLEKRFSGSTLVGFWLYYGDGSRRNWGTTLGACLRRDGGLHGLIR